MRRTNSKLGHQVATALSEKPTGNWKKLSKAGMQHPTASFVEGYANNHYSVQLFSETFKGKRYLRLSVRRHDEEPIYWDVLQEIKDRFAGKDRFALEIYPESRDLVDVANMRHLWVPLDEERDFGWFKDGE